MPDETEIRPESILKECLKHVKKMQAQKKPATNVLEQFKSIRQVISTLSEKNSKLWVIPSSNVFGAKEKMPSKRDKFPSIFLLKGVLFQKNRI